MKHSVTLKFIAVVLAACSLTIVLGSAFGVILVAEAGLYDAQHGDWMSYVYQEKAEALATGLAESYAVRSRGGFSKEELQHIGWGNSWQTLGMWQDLGAVEWFYTIEEDGNVQESTYDPDLADTDGYTFAKRVSYPTKVTVHDDWTQNYSIYGEGTATRMLYIKEEASPEYKVTIWFAPNSIHDYRGIALDVYDALLRYRYYYIAGLGAGLLLAAACLVYLYGDNGNTYNSQAVWLAESKPGIFLSPVD